MIITNVDLLEEEQGIAPGQACVFYSKNEHRDDFQLWVDN